MGNSLRDQLLKTGLGTEKQAKQAEAERARQRKQAKKGDKNKVMSAEAQAAREEAARRQAAKIARDRALNQKREQEKQQKAEAARIRELIEANQIKREDGEIAFNFTHGSKIKKIYVSAGQHKQLSAGKLAIVSYKGRYLLVAAATADRLRELGARALVHQSQPDAGGEDPYADHPIPDDLMW